MEQSRFLTQGSIWKVLIRFTLPFLLANLLQALYGAVDLLVIGKFCSAASVAAVSTATQVTQIITSLITGFTLAGTVLVGKYAGMEKKGKGGTDYWNHGHLFWIIFFWLYFAFYFGHSLGAKPAAGAGSFLPGSLFLYFYLLSGSFLYLPVQRFKCRTAGIRRFCKPSAVCSRGLRL